MKKTTVAIALALASLPKVTEAAPKNNTWYTGSKLGWSQFHDTGWYKASLSNDGPTHKNQLSGGAFGGYQITPSSGFEMGYDWLGRMAYKGDTISGALKAQGVQITAKFGHEINRNLDLYTRFGGMVWHTTSRNTLSGKNYTSGISPVFAGGVELALNRDIAARMEYQWVNNIGDKHAVGVRPDNGLLSIGLSYRFKQEPASQIETTTLDVSPETESNKNFTLKSDVWFNFNESNLNPKGQEELDQLYNQLMSFNSKDASISILGFTDRIGSDDYNQNLSEKRAQSVSNYLISKGIPTHQISIIGMGKSDPITIRKCQRIKDRAALINCLAPDRRVKIEVNGMKNIMTQSQNN